MNSTESNTETSQPFTDNKLLPVMLEAVSCVQMILFKELKADLLARHDQREEAFLARLAAAVINNLYGERVDNQEAATFSAEQRELIEKELRGLSTSLPDSIPIITDSLRMKAICDNQMGVHSMGSLLMARALGLLDEERELPMPSTFMLRVRRLAAERGLVQGSALPADAPE